MFPEDVGDKLKKQEIDRFSLTYRVLFNDLR